MRINNNFNVLPFYDSLQKQNSKKWYSFGQHYPLICPNNKLLPFQFVTNEELTITGNIVAVNVTTGQTTDLGVKPGVMLGTQPGAQYYIVKLAETAINKSLEGLHYLQINTNKGYIYSEEFVFTDSYSECVRLEYWNEDTLNFTSGEINFDDDFKFVMYISSTIGKPEYEFEEELTKRLGYKFIESQTSNKIYKFNFLAPEYICDAMRLVRMCDYIKLTTKYDTYNALSFSYEPKWQNNGDLAAVDVEFDTDCIIQKLESFNRRLKESFYNALLADIDEPVLFSNDTVAQYYTEFTTTSYINGKLIRQLEAISEDELSKSINDIVLPIDNQSDINQVAKKVFLSNIINKFAPQVDLSKYLLKSVWDSVFELRNDIETGKQYIYGKLPVVLQYGLTMYSGDGVDIPSIYAGLPIDNDTIYWKDGILKAKAGTEGAITEITSSMVTSALGYTPYDASNPNGYITSAALANYALSSDVAAVSTKLNDFLEGSDTDNIINKWKELETFLSGLSQSDNLATILGNKAGKTDLAKYIPIAGATDITGEKNFIGGLKVNGSPLYYDTEKKYWKLEGDLLVTGGVTMYGNDSDFVASTIMDAILYDDSTLGINANGELYVKGGTGGGTVSGDYLPLSGGTITNNSAVPLTINANNDGQVGLFLQSKGNNKTYVGWDNSRGTCLYEFASDSSLNILNGVPRFNTNTLWHSGNFYPSNYLPLSGGTINGQIKINTSLDYPFTIKRNSTNASYVAFENNNGYLGDIGFLSDGSLYAYVGGSNKTIWHSGNDGSGSGLDADLLDGVHLMGASGGVGIMQALPRNYTTANQFFGNGNIVIFDPAPTDVSGWGAHSTVLSLGNRETRNHQIIFSIYGGSPMPRYRRNIDGVWSEVRTFAFLDDNVASATKATQDGDGRVITDTYFSDRGASNSFDDKIYNGAYRTSSFKPNDAYGYGLVASFRSMETCAQIYFPDNNREPQFRMQWNSHAGISSGWTGLVTTSSIGNYQAGSAVKDGNGNIITSTYLPINGNGKLTGSYDVLSLNSTHQNGSVLRFYLNDVYKGEIGWYKDIGVGIYDSNGASIYLNNGSVGVGTNAPSRFFDVAGNASVHALKISSTSSTYHLEFSRGGANYLYAPSGGYIRFVTNGKGLSSSNADMIISDSSVTVQGNLLTTGGVTMYSDIRKKAKLKDVVLSLQQVANAPLIEHYYNSDQNKTTHVGSIAQYWAEMNDWFCKKDSEGFYTMEIQNAALASAISVARELVKFETETDRRIRLLEEENKRLKEEVECLKLNIA